MPEQRLVAPRYPAVLWEQHPEIIEATIGKSVHTLNRWSRKEGLTKYTRGTGNGSRDYWLTDEVLAFLAATGRTNHDNDSAAESGD